MLPDVWFHFILYDHSLSQELLVAELKNLGAKGRKSLVEAWSQYLPKYGDPPFKLAHDGSNGPGGGGHAGPPGQPNGGSAAGSNGGGGGGAAGSEESTAPSEDEDADEEDDEDDANSSAVQAKRNQVTQKIAIFAAVQSKK